MNATLLDYIKWRSDITFEMSPFNNIDAAIFAHLAYEHLEGLVSDSFTKATTLQEVAAAFQKSENLRHRTSMGYGINPKTPEILYECAKSKRFGSINVCALQEKLDFENYEQFAAMTFYTDSMAIIAYRGTDDSIAGWCEDLLLAKDAILPSHIDGLRYLQEAADELKTELVLLGHSKGGSVAVYSGTFIAPEIQNRISHIYNMDGPGWSENFYSSAEYQNIADKVFSIYPQVDLIGKMFLPTKNFIIVDSDGKGIEQHDMLKWHCLCNDFIKVDDYSDDSKFFFRSINGWHDEVSAEGRVAFVDALIDIYKSCGYEKNQDLMQNKLNATRNMLTKYNKLDKATKKQFNKVLGVLRKVILSEIPFFAFLNNDLPDSIKQSAQKVKSKIKLNPKSQKEDSEENSDL